MERKPFSIRPMAVDDFSPVYKLGLRCYNVLDKPYNYWSLREVASHLEGNPDLCFVAESERRVVAFVMGDRQFEILKNTGHLEWIAVDEEFRRQGIASCLIREMEQVFRRLGKEQIVADISSENTVSRAMAQHSGFSKGISVTFFIKKLK